MPDVLGLDAEHAIDQSREPLAALNLCCDQLVEVRALERGRLVDQSHSTCRESLQTQITWLDGAMGGIDAQIANALAETASVDTVAPQQSIKGVGSVTCAVLIAPMAEFGTLSPTQIAAPAGLAPHNRDSDTLRRQRHMADGCSSVGRALYMAALSAIRSVARFKTSYRDIKARNGNAKVAAARKLLVNFNAMLKRRALCRPVARA